MRLTDLLRPAPVAVSFGRRSGSPLSVVRSSQSVVIANSDGQAVELGAASTSLAGVMAATDRMALDAAAHQVMPAASALANRAVPSATGAIRTLGMSSAEDGGGGLYRRTSAEPSHPGKIRSLDRFLSGGGSDETNGGWWELVPESGVVRVSQFGGVEGDDITVALQAAIDFAIYRPGPVHRPRVLIDLRSASISDTIHLGYGDAFRTVILEGLGRAYTPAEQNVGTSLFCTMTDRPAIMVTAGRQTTIRDLTLYGPAQAVLQAMPWHGLSPTEEASWDAALASVGVTPGRRHAPHVAICVDGYVGAAPADGYPAPTPPAWTGASGGYGANGSSQTTLERVNIRGFEVGVAQTPADGDGNGDFLRWIGGQCQACKFVLSIGQTQARNNTLERIEIAYTWIALTNKRHGRQTGNLGLVCANSSFAGFVGALFEISNPAYGDSALFQSCDVESLWRIGDIGASSACPPIRFIQCRINFRHSNANGHPANVLVSTGRTPVIFDGGEFSFGSVLSFVSPGIRIMGGCRIAPSDQISPAGTSRAKAYGRLAHNALMGGIVVDWTQAPIFAATFNSYNLDSGALLGDRLIDAGHHETSRAFGVPVYAGLVARNSTQRKERAGPLPFQFESRNRGAYGTPPSRSGRAITFVYSGASNEQSAIQLGYANGGIIRDNLTGTVAFIRSVDRATGAVEAELQNNCIEDGAGGWAFVDQTFDPSTGNWQVLPAGFYLPQRAIVGSVTSGSAEIEVQDQGNAGAVTRFGLEIGDWLAEDSDTVRTFSSSGAAEISAIDTATRTITMGGAAAASISGHQFDWWIRAEPANEAAR